MENKAFFEYILINDIHGLAAFTCDWSAESLFVCVIEKHLKQTFTPTPPPKKVRMKKKVKVALACLRAPFFHLIHTPLSCGSVAWPVRLPLAGAEETWQQMEMKEIPALLFFPSSRSSCFRSAAITHNC